MRIRQELLQRQIEGRPIRVGAYGADWIGSGFVAQMRHVPGMEVSVLADANMHVAWNAFVNTGVPHEAIVEANAAGPATDALRAGKRVVTGSYALAAQLEDIDIVTEGEHPLYRFIRR